MAVITQELSIDATRIEVVTAKGANPNDLHRLIISKSSGDIYVGGPDVTVANGFLVEVGEAFELDLSLGDAIFAVAAAAQTARALVTRT